MFSSDIFKIKQLLTEYDNISRNVLHFVRFGVCCFNSCSKVLVSSAVWRNATISSFGRTVFTTWNITSSLILNPTMLMSFVTSEVLKKRTQLQ